MFYHSYEIQIHGPQKSLFVGQQTFCQDGRFVRKTFCQDRNTWPLFEQYFCATWAILGHQLRATWTILERYLGTTFGNYLNNTLAIVRDKLVTTWGLLGHYLINTWAILRDNLATTWPILGLLGWYLGKTSAILWYWLGDALGVPEHYRVANHP